MKIPITADRSKPKTFAIARICLLWLSACAPAVMVAPFPSRPDTTLPGDLVGPYDGQVVDGDGKPVPNALVYASYGFEVGSVLSAPAGAREVTVETDANGQYFLPRLSQLPRSPERLERVTLIIYKAGYVTYRSDRRWDLSERHDFSQRANRAVLEPAPSDLSHARHVAFAGGGPLLRRELQSEIMQAALELEQPTNKKAAEPMLDASTLLSIDELKAVTAYQGAITTERLSDFPQTGSYDSLHFRASERGESYDAAIRLWKSTDSAALEQVFAQIRKAMPNSAALPAAIASGPSGDTRGTAVRGSDGHILSVAAYDRSGGLVVQVTCGVDLCKTSDKAIALVRRIIPRAERVSAK